MGYDSRQDGFFQRPGEDLEEVGFTNKGGFRHFFITADRQESPFFIQALEKCGIVCIKTLDLKHLIARNCDWLRIYTSLLESGYIRKEEREADFLFYTATVRVRDDPSLTVRIQQHLAGYLGVTPQILSRLLKKQSSLNIWSLREIDHAVFRCLSQISGFPDGEF